MLSEIEIEKFEESLDIIEELLDTIDSMPKPWQVTVGWDISKWISKFLYDYRSDSVYAKPEDDDEEEELDENEAYEDTEYDSITY